MTGQGLTCFDSYFYCVICFQNHKPCLMHDASGNAGIPRCQPVATQESNNNKVIVLVCDFAKVI